MKNHLKLYTTNLTVPSKHVLRRHTFLAFVYCFLCVTCVGAVFLRLLRQEISSNVVSCYYNTPNYSAAAPQLLPLDIRADLCTHINVAFANIINKTIYIDDHQHRALLDIIMLRNKNPHLKLLLSVGGSGNDGGFSEMIINHASRKTFIKSIKHVLNNYSLNGIDLDWEFPAAKVESGILMKRQRQHFSQLLREIRMEYIREKKDYLLTVAVAAPKIIVDVAYDVDQLNLYTDYVNIMTYDFHMYTPYTPFTGLNSALFARRTENMYLSTLNINFTVHMYQSKGLEANKIVVGIPTYGHTFTLVNPDNPAIGSPASGYGRLGGNGFVSYPEICSFIQTYKSDITLTNDTDAKVPYLFRTTEWISYDNQESVIEKAAYIKEYGLRGAMLYSLNADDYSGICTGNLGKKNKFPLSESVRNIITKRLNNINFFINYLLKLVF